MQCPLSHFVKLIHFQCYGDVLRINQCFFSLDPFIWLHCHQFQQTQLSLLYTADDLFPFNAGCMWTWHCLHNILGLWLNATIWMWRSTVVQLSKIRRRIFWSNFYQIPISCKLLSILYSKISRLWFVLGFQSAPHPTSNGWYYVL